MVCVEPRWGHRDDAFGSVRSALAGRTFSCHPEPAALLALPDCADAAAAAAEAMAGVLADPGWLCTGRNFTCIGSVSGRVCDACRCDSRP